MELQGEHRVQDIGPTNKMAGEVWSLQYLGGSGLADQSGNYVVFERRLNLEEYQSINTNQLHNRYPNGSRDHHMPPGSIPNKAVGAINHHKATASQRDEGPRAGGI